MALISASITSSFGVPTFRLSSPCDTSWYDMTSCHQNPMRKRYFLRVTVLCEAIMNDPLDAAPLPIITKAVAEVSKPLSS